MDISKIAKDLQDAVSLAQTSRADLERAQKALKDAEDLHAGAITTVQALHKDLADAVSTVVPLPSGGSRRIG